MSKLRSVVCLGALAGVLSGCFFSGYGDAPSQAVVADATDWLVDRQQTGGGFEVAGFPGFETPDAVLAIGEDAQTGLLWSSSQARAAADAVTTGGRSGLDWLDDYGAGSFGALTPGTAAKLIALTAIPFGYSATAFDPEGDGATNLLAIVNAGANPNGSYGAPGLFNGTLYAAIAKWLTNGAVPPATLTYVRSTQQPNGGWNFAGNPVGADVDIDTTSLAIQVLRLGGATIADPDVDQALELLADNQQPNGSWQAFGSNDPNSTALAIIAITAVGHNPASPCWRDTVDPAREGDPYSSPIAWLRDQQAPNGRIASPNDAFPPVNTFATSQGIQGLRRAWFPKGRALATVCS